MYMRLAFAIAASVDPDVLLLDEVLAVGDEAFAEKCFERIRAIKAAGEDDRSGGSRCGHDLRVVRTRGLDGPRKLRAYGDTAEVLAAYHADLHPGVDGPAGCRAVAAVRCGSRRG